MDTTVCNLTEPFPITADLAAKYQRDGHVLLHGLLPSQEMEHYRALISEIVEREGRPRTVRVSDDVSSPLFLHMANVWRSSEEIRELVFARRFARIAAELMGVHRVRLYHDEALLKEPGGVATPWHKDHYNWPLATHHTIRLWLALADIRLEMGGMRYATGTHRAGQFPEMHPSYEADELFKRIIRAHNIPVVSYSMKAGNASFHSGELLHSALPNESLERREVLAVIYYEDGAKIMEPNHEHRRRDMAEFFPGLRAGDIAASALNPLLYADAG